MCLVVEHEPYVERDILDRYLLTQLPLALWQFGVMFGYLQCVLNLDVLVDPASLQR